MGRERIASQMGRGMRIVSMKQVVGIGEERVECGPKPSGRLVQSIFLALLVVATIIKLQRGRREK